MQVQLSSHTSQIAESYVTVEQLKDVESRSLSRTAAATACCEERAVSAATTAVRAVSEQAQGHLESLRDRINAELASIQATVRVWIYCC
jgi:hypothetical protein